MSEGINLCDEGVVLSGGLYNTQELQNIWFAAVYYCCSHDMSDQPLMITLSQNICDR